MSGNSRRISCAAREPFGGLRGRHSDVHHHQVGPKRAHLRQQLLCVLGSSHDLHARALQQGGQPFTEQDVVVGDDHSRRGHG